MAKAPINGPTADCSWANFIMTKKAAKVSTSGPMEEPITANGNTANNMVRVTILY